MITVFTPTYNRAYLLPRLYKSLQAQTTTCFEWLIVDDGSRDNTADLVQQWQKEEKSFSIVFLQQLNGGKHRAINTALARARGEWFFIVDSDDWLPADAIYRISQAANTLPAEKTFAGICGFKANKFGRPLGNSSSLNRVMDASMIEIRQKYHIKGDMAEVFRTDILRQYPFPTYPGETFLNEAVVWNQMAEKYILRYIPEILYFCEYRDDGLTKSIRQKYRQNPQGTIHLYRAMLKSPLFNKKTKIRACILYWRYLCLHTKAYRSVALYMLLWWPIGFVFFIYDLVKGMLWKR